MKRQTRFLIIMAFISGVLLTACGEKENYVPGNLQFFETYFPAEIGSQWQMATVLSRSKEAKNQDTSPANNSDTTELSQINSSDKMNNQKGLADYVKSAGNYALGFVSPEDKNAVEELLNREDILSLFPEDIKFMWSANLERISYNSDEEAFMLYAVRIPKTGKAKVGGADIKSATTGYDKTSGKITVDLTMTEKGAEKWEMMTSDNIERMVAITMDNAVYSAPRVINAISGGNTQISGSFTLEFAEKLCGRINAFSSQQ